MKKNRKKNNLRKIPYYNKPLINDNSIIKSKSETAITLMTLGITIVILLILAGVTMNILTGDHGMIDEASNAAIQSETSKIHEDWEVTFDSTGKHGYKVKFYGSDNFEYTISVPKVDYNYLYFPRESSYVLASPSDYYKGTGDGNQMVSIEAGGTISKKVYNGDGPIYVKPVVCLKSNVVLKPSDDGTYTNVKLQKTSADLWNIVRIENPNMQKYSRISE